MRPAGFQQVEGADDVGGDEVGRTADGTVDVGFRREVEDVRDVVLADDADNLGLVAEVDLLEAVAGIGFQAADVGGMTGVGEAVEIDECRDPGLVDELADEVGADEAAAAGDE